jgi:large repetitive protein
MVVRSRRAGRSPNALQRLRSILLLTGLTLTLLALTAGTVLAASTPSAATVNGGATTTVRGGATITAGVTVASSGGNQWRGTGWRYGASGAYTCVDTPNHSSGTATETFSITAPAAAGTYTVQFVAYGDGSCFTGASGPYTLSNAVIVDNTAPTVTINQAASQADPTNDSSVAFTVVFSEVVTGFAATDVTVGGTATHGTAVLSGTGPTYTITVPVSTDGTVTASIPAAVATDIAGNSSTASTSTDNAVTRDATAPTVTAFACTPAGTPTSSTGFSCSATFSEAVIGFSSTTSDVAVGGTSTTWTKGASAGSGAGPYTFTVTGGAPASDGTLTVQIAAAAASDAAGNASTASSTLTWTVDTTAPAASIDSYPADPTSSPVASFGFNGSDPVSGGVASGVARLECSIDGASFATCVSPVDDTGLAAGSHSFSVRAVDNADNTGATSTFGWTIDPSTTTSLSSSDNPSTYGDGVDFTATVAGVDGTPTGAIEFFDGATSLGSFLLNGASQATLTTSTLGAGSHSITAAYAGTAPFAGSTSSAVVQSVGLATLDVTASSPAAGVYGDAAPAVGLTYGGFVLGEDATNLTTEPTCSAAYTAGDVPGAYTTSCSGGVSDNYAFNYIPGSFSVGKADPSCTVAGATITYDGNAHGASGSCLGVMSETLSGLVLGASFTNVPGGSADWTFTDVTGNYNDDAGSAAIAIGKADATIVVTGFSGTFDGTAHGATGSATGAKGEDLAGLVITGSFTDVPGGTADWTFTDVTGNYNDDAGSAAIAIGKADATISVTCPTGSQTYTGSAIEPCTASASGVGIASPIDVSGSLLYTDNVNAGTATADASWGGDANHTASTGSGTFTIAKASSATAVEASSDTSPSGHAVTFTATVTPAAATGTIIFLDGTTVVGGCGLVAGTCSADISTLAYGSHSITAAYSGSGNYLESVSPALAHTIDPYENTVPGSTTDATVSGPAELGNPSLTFSTGSDPVVVTMSAQYNPDPSPSTGPFILASVSVFVDMSADPPSPPYTVCLDGSAPQHLFQFDSGAWVDITSEALSGSGRLCGTTSTLTQFVVAIPKAATSVTLDGPASVPFGTAVSLTATVTPATATGSVAFADGATSLGSCVLATGSCVLDLDAGALPAGIHSIVASYGGDADNLAGSSAARAVEVTPSAMLTLVTASPTHAASIQYSLTFSGPISDLSASSFTATGSAASGATACVVTPSASSGTTFTVAVTGCVDGALVLALRANGVTVNGATGPATAVTAASISIDRTAPTTTVTSPATPTSSRTLNYVVGFSEAVSGLTAGDFGISGTAVGCVVGAPTTLSTTSYAVAVTCTSDGTVTLMVKANAAADVAGNTGPTGDVADVAGLVTIDTTGPTATLVCTPGSGPTNASTINCTATFSEALALGSSFDAADVLVGGAATGWTVGSPAAAGSGSYAFTVSGGGEGLLTLAVKAAAVTDAAGNAAAASATANLQIDRTNPTATAPSVSVRTGAALSGARIPVTVTWSGADGTGSGVARYILSWSINGRAPSQISAALTSTSIDLLVPSSGTVRFSVQAIDLAGNTGASAAGVKITPRLVQQSTTSIKYKGTWSAIKAKAYSGGSVKSARKAAASATFKFTGRAIGLVSTMGPKLGKVRVMVDGIKVATIDLSRPKLAYRQLVWQQSWAKSRSHTIKLIVLGTAGRPRVDLDAFVTIK